MRDHGFCGMLQVGIEHERLLPLQKAFDVQHQGAPLRAGRLKVDAQVQQGRLANLTGVPGMTNSLEVKVLYPAR